MTRTSAKSIPLIFTAGSQKQDGSLPTDLRKEEDIS